MRALLSTGVMASLSGLMATAAVDQQAARQALTRAYPEARLRIDAGGVTRIASAPFGFGASPAETATAFVERFAAALGAEPDDLVPGNRFNDRAMQPVMLDEQTGTYGFTLLYYRQQRDGTPVFGAELRLLVRNEEGYPLVWAGSTLRNLADFAVNPAHAATRFDRLAQVAPRMTSFGGAQTVIWAGQGGVAAEPRLAVAFVADNLDDAQASWPERWRFVVDRVSGEILSKDNLIAFADITGSVAGQASTGIEPDFCVPEAPMAMPYAQVEIVGGSSTFADADGAFLLPCDAGVPVTVRSLVRGQYFIVDNYAGDEEILTISVTPPGPADFMHNADNDDELVRAQVNAYVQANVVRDFCLAIHPDYPTISTQTGFWLNINRDDLGCPGNGWYAGSSINLCRAQDPFPNTAYTNIIHHEYGHHIVQTGGSGQMAYGQGMADTIATLIADDPRAVCGIFGDCDYYHRTADNDVQYPCYDTLDYCGQLLSGCIWDTRQELAVTEPDEALAIISELTINSILLHQGTLITPEITIDFLTLDDDDGTLHNGTPHSDEICAGFSAHGMGCPRPGDLDGDGDVDLADLARLLAAYDTCLGDPLYDALADLNGSGCVDLGDLAVLLANYDVGP